MQKVQLLKAKKGVHSVQQDEMPEIRNWGWSGKTILQVSIAVFLQGHCRNIFGQRWLSPLEKIGPTRMRVRPVLGLTPMNVRVGRTKEHHAEFIITQVISQSSVIHKLFHSSQPIGIDRGMALLSTWPWHRDSGGPQGTKV